MSSSDGKQAEMKAPMMGYPVAEAVAVQTATAMTPPFAQPVTGPAEMHVQPVATPQPYPQPYPHPQPVAAASSYPHPQPVPAAPLPNYPQPVPAVAGENYGQAVPSAFVQPVASVPSASYAPPSVPMTIGPQDAVPLLDAETAGILAAVNSFTIKQRVKWWEALSQGICEQQNTYDIFDKNTGAHLFIAQERSDGCNRCCCAPHHSVRVDFLLVNSGDRVWSRGEQYRTVMSMERLGCCDKPCLGCFICHDSCKDGMFLQAGGIVREPGIVGVDDRTIGAATQPKCGGYFTPTINLLQRTTQGGGIEGFQPIAKIEGPCIFGGCSELCCRSHFLVSGMTSDTDGNKKLMIGDLAVITKEKPRTCSGCAREAFTDSDHFTMEYKQGVGLTPQQKATMMAGLLLTDYVLFEQDNGMCEYKNQQLYITFFDCYCCGCVCPCQVAIGGNNNGGGD